MLNNNLLKLLQDRGLVNQITHQKKISKILDITPITIYCGFDPTSDSLHLGHLIPLLCLKRFQLFGHKPIVLIGGATGLIGDPSFRINERKLNNDKIVQSWIEKIKKQIYLFLDFNCGFNSAVIVNNYEWFSSMNVISFLNNIGKYFNINQMINKDAIKKRISRNEVGVSFSEFSYNLLQSYDFAYLYKKYKTILQIGGSDQWGNIISGVNLIYRLYKKIVFGLTLPLITKSDGTKFGKTGSDTLWLDENKTSPYKFYQFWLNISDSDVYNFLKFFTFIDISEINEIENFVKSENKKFFAQKILAEFMTKLVHGKFGLLSAKRITKCIFTSISIVNLTKDDFLQLVKDGITTVNLKYGINLQEALVNSNLAPSITQAKLMINSSAITINKKKQNKNNYIFNKEDILYNKYTLICRGKKNYCLIIWK